MFGIKQKKELRKILDGIKSENGRIKSESNELQKKVEGMSLLLNIFKSNAGNNLFKYNTVKDIINKTVQLNGDLFGYYKIFDGDEEYIYLCKYTYSYKHYMNGVLIGDVELDGFNVKPTIDNDPQNKTSIGKVIKLTYKSFSEHFISFEV